MELLPFSLFVVGDVEPFLDIFPPPWKRDSVPVESLLLVRRTVFPSPQFPTREPQKNPLPISVEESDHP